MLDGTQRQQLLMKANIVSQLMIAISLWLTIYLGLGLYSLGLSQLVGILFFYCQFLYLINVDSSS